MSVPLYIGRKSVSDSRIFETLVEFFRENTSLLIEFSWGEIKARYARSVLGPFWLVMTTAISVLGLSYIWSILFNQDKETFIPSLTIGLVIWQFISACINEAPYCFNTYGSVLRNYSHNILLYPSAIVIKNFIVFLHNLLIVAFVLMVYPQGFGISSFLLIPGLLMLLPALVLTVSVIAIVGARYKDLGPAINSFMAIVFFLSPVMYKPDQLGVKEYLMWFNPFSYFITVVRDPITGTSSPLFVYLAMLLFLFSGSVLVWLLLSRYRYRVPYWL